MVIMQIKCTIWSLTLLALALPGGPALAEGEIDLNAGPALAEIGTEELRGLIDKSNPALVLVDARGPEVYAQGHLPRAINLPADRVEAMGPALPKEAEIVVYCGSPQCPHSTVVARWLMERGWPHVRHYAEGWAGWTAAGGAVETGPGPNAGRHASDYWMGRR